MVNKLYIRLMATQCLLLVTGGFLFWLTSIRLDWPDPLAVMIAVFLPMLVAAVVIGVVLHPIDQVLLATRRLAVGEPLPLPTGRSGDVQAMIASLERIQDRLKPQAPERSESPELLMVLNSLSEGIMVMNPQLEVTYVNAALQNMASSEDLTSGEGPKQFRTIFHARCFVPDQLALIEEETLKAPDRPRTDIIQVERPKQFLKRFSAPLYNDRHERTGFLVSYTDITRDVEMDALRQDFIANASHELRTPVTSVKVLLENLQDGAKDDPAVRDEFINDAAREIDRMHDLVNELLDLAALESGRNALTLTTFALPQVVEEAVSTVAPQANQRGVNIVSEWQSEGLRLEADATRVRQVLVNLVTNAVKFTPAGGEVKVKAWEENGLMRIAISDTGIGIPAKDLPHIFDRFFRVTRGRSRLQGGSGLGLTIVKQAIDAHRGEIIVESTEGAGTTFFIALPLKQAAKEEQEA